MVVPVGAVVFTEHVIFPRIGYTRYWLTYRKLRHSTPAVSAWIVGLIFGFTLNALDVMSFYYLFIPTWFFTAIVYTILAKKYGAAEKYPEQVAADIAQAKIINAYQAKQAANEPKPIVDNSKLTKLLHLFSRASLVITLALAASTMFRSPDLTSYDFNREIFYRYAFICTLIYFGAAYWALRRKKALLK